MAHADSPMITFVDALWPARLVGFEKALAFGLMPFVWGGLLKTALALMLAASRAAMVRKRLGA